MSEYYTVFPFMVNCLMLKGAAANVYAVIFGFWLSGCETYQSNSTLATRLGYARETTNRILAKLKRQNLITVLPETTRYGCRFYTINVTTLDEKAPDWRLDLPPKTQLTCEKMSHLIVGKCHTLYEKKSHLSVRKCHTPCEKMSHKKINDIESINRKERNFPLPKEFTNDEEILWLTDKLMQSEKWANRTTDMLAEATKNLAGKQVEVAREMIRYTISGNYPRIYEPNEEVLEKARKVRCDKTSHLKDSKRSETTDEAIFGKVISIVPQELREFAYGTRMGTRALRFLAEPDGYVTIFLPYELQDWFAENKIKLEPLAQEWVGERYKGLKPLTNN